MNKMTRDTTAVARLRWACYNFAEGVRGGATGDELEYLGLEMERAHRHCLRLGVPEKLVNNTIDQVAAKLREKAGR